MWKEVDGFYCLGEPGFAFIQGAFLYLQSGTRCSKGVNQVIQIKRFVSLQTLFIFPPREGATSLWPFPEVIPPQNEAIM
jgi:hypothetical protein